MAGSTKEYYLNFPVELLKDALPNISATCDSILKYCIYDHFLKLEFGTDEEKIRSVSKYLNFEIPYSELILEGIKGVFESIECHNIKTGVKTSMIFEFRDNEKTESETVSFLAFCALKSIIGSKPYSKTTNDHLLARMAGLPSSSYIENNITAGLQKFNTRRKLDGIKNELRFSWGLALYGGTNGFYVSFKLSLENLIYQAKKISKVCKEKHLREAEKVALKLANERLKRDEL